MLPQKRLKRVAVHIFSLWRNYDTKGSVWYTWNHLEPIHFTQWSIASPLAVQSGPGESTRSATCDALNRDGHRRIGPGAGLPDDLPEDSIYHYLSLVQMVVWPGYWWILSVHMQLYVFFCIDTHTHNHTCPCHHHVSCKPFNTQRSWLMDHTRKHWGSLTVTVFLEARIVS